MSIQLDLHCSRLESVCSALAALEESAIRLQTLRQAAPDQPMLALTCEFPAPLEDRVLRSLLAAGPTSRPGEFRITLRTRHRSTGLLDDCVTISR